MQWSLLKCPPKQSLPLVSFLSALFAYTHRY
jgi:hypothetical protein